MIPNHFVIIWDGSPVGLDSNSGGYPYMTHRPAEIKYWTTREEARKYMSLFPAERTWWLAEVQFRIVNV